jgi:hypothetical protein
MGVIKKKTGTRGTEGGIKYVCDVCSSDITSTVSPAIGPAASPCSPTSSVGPHSLRKRRRLPRVRPLRPMFLRRQGFARPRPSHPRLQGRRAALHTHLHRGLGRRRGASTARGRRDIRSRLVGGYCRPHRWLPRARRGPRPLHQHLCRKLSISPPGALQQR